MNQDQRKHPYSEKIVSENKRPTIRVMVKSSVKKSVLNFSKGCCVLLKPKTKFIALGKVHRKYCGCRYKFTDL